MMPSKSKNKASVRKDCSPQGLEEEAASVILPGLKPVLELLTNEPARIDSVFVRRGLRGPEATRLLDLCREAGIRFQLVDAQVLDRLCARSGEQSGAAVHQGVAARLYDVGYTDYDELLASAPHAPLPLILALDQVQDAGNAGALARTLYALGGAGLVFPRHNAAFLGARARRSAAGALERLPVSRVTNLARALDEAEEAGFTIYAAATGPGSLDALTAPLQLPAVLVLGNEEHGIRPLVAKRCAAQLAIPLRRDFDSLNVAQAGGILVSCFARAFPFSRD